MNYINPILNKVILFAVFFIFLFLYTKLAGPIPFAVTSVSTTKSDSFSVTGTGKVEIKPDSAMVTVGVTKSGATAKDAQESLNESINKVSASIKSLGIAEIDIKTANFNVSPNYDYTNNAQRIINYSANTNLTIKVRELEKANLVLDTATKEGATQIGGISFDNIDDTKAKEEAREKAVADAKKKAATAAKAAGFSLGKIVNYQEDFGGGGYPRPLLMEKAVSSDSGNTQVEPGSNEVVVTVTLSYEVK